MTTVGEIRPKVGKLHPSLRGAGAWWVGTDLAAEGVAEFERRDKAWVDEFEALARSLDCDPKRMWVYRSWGEEHVEAFTPNDPDNLAGGLRLADGYRDKAVPAARYKAGKAINVQLSDLRRRMVTGAVDTPGSRRDGSFLTAFPQVLSPTRSTHPIMLLNVDPLQNTRRGSFDVDEQVWQRVPLSVLHALLEEQVTVQ